MALGKLADLNLAVDAALAGGAWSEDLPLANLKVQPYVARPARCLDATDLEASRIEIELIAPRAVSLFAVLFHTLSASASYRLRLWEAGDEPLLAHDSGWTPVYPGYRASYDLVFEEENWFTGQAASAELQLYPPHIWMTVPGEPIVASALLEINDVANPQGWFDLGGLFIAAAFSPAYNYDRGHQLEALPRDQVEETPGGDMVAEERTPRRKLSVTWSNLTFAEADRLFDAGMRARVTRPVLFVPDADDLASLVREAFPATFAAPPAPVKTYDGISRVSATFLEILA